MAIIATTTASTPIASFHRLPMYQIFSKCSFLTLNFAGNRKPIKHKLNIQNSLVSTKASSSVAQAPEPMVPPFNVLITGSTKGIGYALAKEFLKANDNVVICSRSDERVQSALERLQVESGKQHVWGTKCDVRNGDDVKKLVAFAQEKLKYIDIWINNAGSNAYSYKPLIEASDEDLVEVVSTNTLGLMICCREAIKMMLNQPRGGHIFNIDGAGSDGRPTPRFAAYGATKRSVAMHYFAKKRMPIYFENHFMAALGGSHDNARMQCAELRMQDVKNVILHNLSIFSRFAFGARRNRYIVED
ncbi:unnamed protein product [Fraxinus pennsylvanica]|uniref:Chlorophyll(Ide) b reductase NOL, chloroplastic n=1 Tax=Fraxinus pennsylvanica TaxID=56036 RepID=A0AAD1ZJ68_9LAMI|nr:unnamed protein product [Fraxinus pennsylvanica]